MNQQQRQKYKEFLRYRKELTEDFLKAQVGLDPYEHQKYEEWVNRTGAANRLETPIAKDVPDTADTLGKHLHHVERVIQLGANNGILLTGADLVKLVLEFPCES